MRSIEGGGGEEKLANREERHRIFQASSDPDEKRDEVENINTNKIKLYYVGLNRRNVQKTDILC